ncbi:S8 family serine peptidase [Brachybacterium sp. EF45031]|uniref:S8 family serine peptidase n=1 Tax=Brachybacterium sillae TaxID=2810536 RepID=UPI002559A2FD|nr:S8 family serine peptidase [Brachybacterium sillae]MCS6710701.1 S8 family serine peptidase [Brachybacterium sillae]
MAGKWLVKVAGPSTMRGGKAATIQRDHKRVEDAARTQGIDVSVTARHSTAWNGLSVRADARSAAALRALPGVEAVYPVYRVDAPTPTGGAQPQDEYQNALTGVDTVQRVDGLTGKGVKVAVIDSGTDYNNPDLGGSGVNDERRDFPNSRVVGGYDFVGDDYNSEFPDPQFAATPDAFPDDRGGHGTHVAGIIGADGEVTGAAPDAQLLSYRIFGCEGTSDTDVILQAMERAAADGADVINMSLGVPLLTWSDYPTAQLANELTGRGVVMVVSAGNEGAVGTFSGGAPGVAHDVITVASVENTHARTAYATIGGVDAPIAPAEGAAEPPTSGSLALVSAGAPGTPAAQACDPSALAPAPAEATALLIERGSCTFREKALAAQQAGYDAVVLYNNSPGMLSPTVAGDPAISIPVVMISQADGLAAQERLAAGEALTLQWQEGTTIVENQGAGLVSDFSSYGLAADLALKPDLAAPGGQIWSTYPLERGGHANLSGTSMAAPHVAGAAALLLQAHPDRTPAQVKAAFMNTADPLDFSLLPGQGLLEPVHRQGAGLLDAVEAVHTTSRIEPVSISLGEGEQGLRTVTVTVQNTSDAPVTYAVGVRHGVATGEPTYDPEFSTAQGIARPSAETITVPARGTASVDVTLGEELGVDGVIYGGWLTFTNDTEDLVVPFGGLSGDYQALTALADAGMGLPSLAAVTPDGQLELIGEDGHTYTLRDGDVPTITYYLAYPVQRLEVRAYRVMPNGRLKAVHPRAEVIDGAASLGRNGDVAVYQWDGGVTKPNGTVNAAGDGTYVLQLRALKAQGDESNPEHWETWTSPQFTVQTGKTGRVK